MIFPAERMGEWEFVQRAGQCPSLSHTGIAFMKVKSFSGL